MTEQQFRQLMDDAEAASEFLRAQAAGTVPPPAPADVNEQIKELIVRARDRKLSPEQRQKVVAEIQVLRARTEVDPQSYWKTAVVKLEPARARR
jgi:hypothetical protein